MVNSDVSLENCAKNVLAQLVSVFGILDLLDVVARHRRNKVVLEGNVLRTIVHMFGATQRSSR